MNIAYIPMRSGSKRVKDKNIRDFNGKPLFYWNIKALDDSSMIDRIYVGVDCDFYSNRVKEQGFRKVEIYRRHSSDFDDYATTESSILNLIKDKKLHSYDNFILVQVTTPFLKSNMIDNALTLLSFGHNDSILSVCEFDRFLWDRFYHKPTNYNLKDRKRSQEFENEHYVENGMFYINTVGNIEKNKTRLSGSVGYYILPQDYVYEIDSELDFKLVEIVQKELFDE